jgi:hypothetical protein
VGPLMHDRIIGALELCCRLGEMLLIQNKRVDWDTHTIGIPGHTTKDKENRRIPFEELRKGLEVSWKQRTFKAVAGGNNA